MNRKPKSEYSFRLLLIGDFVESKSRTIAGAKPEILIDNQKVISGRLRIASAWIEIFNKLFRR